MTAVNDLREAFLSYFEMRGHMRQASAPLVPENDPSLLFVNAGMVPFKNIFTGAETPFAECVTTSQKCVRAGGKHNDLDNVGYTARHHTFFEMLGNFSFGAYFKEEAIDLAWTFVTGELGLSPDRLLITVHAEDEEAGQIWKKRSGFSDNKIIPIASSDNFWSIGNVGPCGPCSEIFYDHGERVAGGPPGSEDAEGDRFVEIWNLVFMAFEQKANGDMSALPRPSVDTGMGLERIAAVLQGVINNYDIDLFRNLIAAAEALYRQKAQGQHLASFRVIADHLRAAAFLIADGVMPLNEGRGYVLRRIMRRAMRHAHNLGARQPGMHELTPVLIAEMGHIYPELVRAQNVISSTLESEEARFQRTLGRGLGLLDTASKAMQRGDVLPGETAFKLYDTYGFPLDLTQDILRTRGVNVDTAGFEEEMARRKQGSRTDGFHSGDMADSDVWFRVRDGAGATVFTGYERHDSQANVQAIIADDRQIDRLEAGQAAAIVLDTTPFYAESGGQAGDHGVLTFDTGQFAVEDVQKRAGDLHAHIGTLTRGSLSPGQNVCASINTERRKRIMANHSATHLLHAALRNVLGVHVMQKGSLVEAARLRFDFSHNGPVTAAELRSIEDEVNAVIRQNAAPIISISTPDAAIEAGALALFGEKYGEKVRVLAMGEAIGRQDKPYSVELCGGTHVRQTGDIALFTIIAESGVAAGVRRIEAATGAEALAFLRTRAQIASDIAADLNVPVNMAAKKVRSLGEEQKTLHAALAEARRMLAMAGEGGSGPAAPEDIAGIRLIARIGEGIKGKDLRALIDEAKARLGSGIAVFIGINDGKAAVAVGVTDDLTDTHSAVDLVQIAARCLGGKGGGGRPDMAQAGGPDASAAEAALQAVRDALKAAKAAP